MKKMAQTLFLIFLSVFVFGQNPEDHTPKTYKGEDGKLWWNKNLPVYINLSSSPEKKEHLLESKVHKKYTNPFYFDTEGVNYIRSNWAVDKETKKTIQPKITLLFEVYVDGSAPKTTAYPEGARRTVSGKNTYYGGNLKITLKAYDKFSGVDKTFYSLDDADFKEYTNPILLDLDGKHTLRYYSVDKVGNAEKIGSLSNSPNSKKKNKITVSIDKKPPETKHIAEGVQVDKKNNTILASTGSKVFLHATDDASGVKATYFQIDESEPQLYKNFISMQKLSNGEHVLSYCSEDKVSNKEQAKEYRFFVDKNAPILTSDVLGDRFLVNEQIYFSGRTKLKLIAVDNKAGIKEVKYSIDGGAFQDYSAPFYLPQKTGNHIVHYYAVDRLNNSTNRSNNNYDNYKYSAKKIFVDLVGPTLSHQITGKSFKTRDTLFLGQHSKISLAAKDNESGLQYIAYAIDHNQEETRYTEPFRVKGNGKHLIEYFGYDNVNNRNVQEFYVIVDEDPPQSNTIFSINPIGHKDSLPVYPAYVELYLSAIDKTTGNDKIYYSLNDKTRKLYTLPLKNFPKGKNKLTITAVDKLGNKKSNTLSFYIK